MRHTRYSKQNMDCRVRAASIRCGFTIMELLLALAISSMLLAAVAVAFNASIINYRQNEDMFKVINTARQALTRMTTQLRTAGYEIAPGVWGGVDPLAPSNQCNFWTGTGEDITYEFRNSADPSYPNTLLLITNSDGQEYVLCDNVTAMTFTKTPTVDGTDCKSVQISITVARGNVQRKISAAAVIRRNLSW